MSAIVAGLTEARRDWRRIVSGKPAYSPFCEFVRYGAASAIALAGDFGTLVLLTEFFGIHYLSSAAAGFTVGIFIIYVLSVRWVFCTRRFVSVRLECTLFLLIGIAGLAINQTAMFVLTEIALLPYAASKVGAVALVFSFNFSLRKLVLFTASAESRG